MLDTIKVNNKTIPWLVVERGFKIPSQTVDKVLRTCRHFLFFNILNNNLFPHFLYNDSNKIMR
ncbi:hypothetical protein BUZ61_13345 [Staphylococcus nepalensis]|uniref:Uncharacterized protein n=1 Tax=Staphylococcus nepalensis TaxID=214473 RepID=A0A2T4S784_9STAP|nr:hypothetical protein BUZ61_13345 [Staphylococcus nepalensis]RIN44894.1 hypothetical protein BU049_10415 [Staphylococcus simulans]RIN70307.1 hypothetical protein BU017_08995 [Staphylococcus simulans]